MSIRVIPAFEQVIHTSLATMGAALRLSWPWLLILFPFAVYARPYTSGGMAALIGLNASYSFPLFAVLAAIALSSIAVNWHRYLLRDELAEGFEVLRLDRTVWRYVGASLLIGLVFLVLYMLISLPVFVVFVAVTDDPSHLDSDLGSELLYLLCMFLPLLLSFRLSLRLPAIALDQGEYGFGDAWRDSRGHVSGIAGLLALSGLLLAVPGYVVETVLGMLTGKGFGGMLAAGLVYLGWFWLSSVAALTMLTLLYAILVEGAEV